MNRIHINIFSLLVLICLLFSQSIKAEDSNSDPNIVESKDYILIINFHLESLQWEHNIEDEVIKYIKTQNTNEVYAEHIKALDITSMDELHKEHQRIFNKYPNRPKLVIFIGPAALSFFADAMNEHWKDIPMINTVAQKYRTPLDKYFAKDKDIESFTYQVKESELKKKYNITGIMAHNEYPKQLELIRKVIPDVNHIALISDDRIGSVIIREKIKELMIKQYPNMSFEFITPSNYTTDQMLNRVASFDERTGIIFHLWAPKGSNAEDYYVWNNIYKTVGQVAKMPVFVFWDMNVENGFIAGGYFNRMIDVSNAAVGLMKKVLSGTQPKNIPYVAINKEKAYLNYANIKSYHSNKINFPSDAVYFLKPENIIYTYRYYIIIITIIVLSILAYCAQHIIFLNKAKNKQNLELEKRKKLHEEIGLRNFKLALALEVSTVNPWVWDLSKKIFMMDDVKRMMENPNGCEPPEPIDEDVFMNWILKDDRERMKSIFANLRNGKSNYLKEECRMRTPNDKEDYNWYMIQAVVYEKNNLGKPLTLIGTTTLITESKELELELIKAKEEAEESDRLKSTFLANLSHEIRTPLNAIVGFSGVLANSEEIEERRELANIVQHNNKLLLSLINDILEISKIESGNATFTYSATDINQLLEKMKSNNEGSLCSDVKMTLELGMDKCLIHTDKKRVKQILNNLISNAIKFTQHGTITIGYYKPEDNKIRFFVKDTGCGIPQEQLQTIFGRFVKLNSFEQGTGLGLSVAQLIVKKMHGEIGVYSEYRQGSEFWFELPYEPIDESEELESLSATNKDKTEIIILIAEDTQSNFMVLKSMLDENCKLIHAWNGKEAIEFFKIYNPDLVLMDIKMPVMDGYSAVAEIRKISTTVPIVAISAYAFDDDGERMLKRGFNDYQSKPVDKKKISKMISTIIQRKKNNK